MKAIFISFLFFVFLNVANAQTISVADFKKIIELPSLESAKKYIEGKGFSFYKVTDSKIGNVTTTSWSYGYNARTDEATAWMSVSCDGNKPIRTYYEVFDFSLSLPLVNDVQKNSYKYEHIESNDEEFTTRYSIPDYYLFQYQKKDTKEGYKFECIKKFSKADPLNGTSIKYYPHGHVKYSVEVRNGKWNGVSKSYNEEGIQISEGNWKEDKKEGLFSYYDDYGVLTSTENYQYGSLKDATFYHPNGKMKRTYQYSFDKRNGKSIGYDEVGNVQEEAFYLSDKLFGSFKQFVNGKESFSAFYSNDTLNGMYTRTLFDEQGDRYAQERGFFKNGFPEGMVTATYDKTRDTLWAKTYKNKQAIGPWKFYSIDGSVNKIITFNAGIEVEQVLFEKGVPVHKLQNMGSQDTSWKIRYTYDFEGYKKEIDFSIMICESCIGGELFDYFGTQTSFSNSGNILEAVHKDGRFFYESPTLRIEGAYRQDKPVGLWKRNYLKSNVSSEAVYDVVGQEILERFTNKKGKPFSGTVSFEDEHSITEIHVKKGIKDGVTSTKK